jgi:hypothetical protein
MTLSDDRQHKVSYAGQRSGNPKFDAPPVAIATADHEKLDGNLPHLKVNRVAVV